MKINILSIFPDFFSSFLKTGIVGKAYSKCLFSVNIIDIREFATDEYGTVDDYPYGGGAGMVMKVEPIVNALESIDERGKIYLLSPRGRLFRQDIAREFSCEDCITLICGRYKGIDERVREYIDGEISIGDYILNGGEVAAMVIMEAVIRLIPGAVGDSESIMSDSFESGILDCPLYTRPSVFRGMNVPEVLLSGNHKEIEKWRKKSALEITEKYRKDLLKKN